MNEMARLSYWKPVGVETPPPGVVVQAHYDDGVTSCRLLVFHDKVEWINYQSGKSIDSSYLHFWAERGDV